jgi:hypothetical protein
MIDDPERFRLQQELLEQREKERQRSQRMKGLLFLSVWWLPLFGMQISGYEPKADVGPVSILGLWFLGVPIAFGLYCYVNKRKDE